MSDEAPRMEGLTVQACERCPELVACRRQIVNGVGPEDAELVIVGEAPGADEDRQGEPFVGRSGRILTEKLAGAGLDRETVRITNCVRCRPPDNRDPRRKERDQCRDWLELEIERVDPTVILTVGKVPAETVLERSVAVTSAAGDVVRARIGGRSRPIVICVHPAAMLYDRSQEATLEAAIRVAADELGITPPDDDQAKLGEF